LSGISNQTRHGVNFPLILFVAATASSSSLLSSSAAAAAVIGDDAATPVGQRVFCDGPATGAVA